MAKLTAGRIVLYMISRENAEEVNRRHIQNAGSVGQLLLGGEVVPAIVVWPHTDTNFNGQAFLDGNDSLWLTSVEEGVGPGKWYWPPRSDGVQATK